MKVIQIIDTLAVGGAEKIVLLIANKLAEDKVSNMVLTTTRGGELESQFSPAVPVMHLHRKSKFDVGAYYRMYQLCRRHDIIHVHSFYNLLYFSVIWLFLLRKKVCYHEHNSFIATKNRPVSFLQKLLLPRTYFIGVSNASNQWAIDKVGVPESRVFLLPNSFLPSSDPIRKEAKKTGEIIKILQVGNFKEGKHYEYSAMLCAAMKEKGLKVTMDFVGKINEPVYFQKVKESIARLGVTENIRFIHDCNDVVKIVSEYDICIHTCIVESGPIILIEYLFSDQVFVSHDTGEVSQIIKKYYPEFFLDNFNTEKWIQTIVTLLEKKSIYQGKLKDIYRKEFSPDIYIQKCQQIYEQAINS